MLFEQSARLLSPRFHRFCVAIMTARLPLPTYQEEMGGPDRLPDEIVEWLYRVLYLVDRKPETDRHAIHQTGSQKIFDLVAS